MLVNLLMIMFMKKKDLHWQNDTIDNQHKEPNDGNAQKVGTKHKIWYLTKLE